MAFANSCSRSCRVVERLLVSFFGSAKTVAHLRYCDKTRVYRSPPLSPNPFVLLLSCVCLHVVHLNDTTLHANITIVYALIRRLNGSYIYDQSGTSTFFSDLNFPPWYSNKKRQQTSLSPTSFHACAPASIMPPLAGVNSPIWCSKIGLVVPVSGPPPASSRAAP